MQRAVLIAGYGVTLAQLSSAGVAADAKCSLLLLLALCSGPCSMRPVCHLERNRPMMPTWWLTLSVVVVLAVIPPAFLLFPAVPECFTGCDCGHLPGAAGSVEGAGQLQPPAG